MLNTIILIVTLTTVIVVKIIDHHRDMSRIDKINKNLDSIKEYLEGLNNNIVTTHNMCADLKDDYDRRFGNKEFMEYIKGNINSIRNYICFLKKVKDENENKHNNTSNDNMKK